MESRGWVQAEHMYSVAGKEERRKERSRMKGKEREESRGERGECAAQRHGHRGCGLLYSCGALGTAAVNCSFMAVAVQMDLELGELINDAAGELRGARTAAARTAAS